MRWGKGAVTPKSLEKHEFWFVWYPVCIYEGRWMWWEWTLRHTDKWGDVTYECLFEGKKP
ncbi:hypothetical protein LCGC14_0448050 [marine sediment metagenome]|uniref:Uncharacterized protein n=1 Tax=marine sediment metagenome TaxID=412755 RepID=A0A0F9SIN0_9ZZZZ